MSTKVYETVVIEKQLACVEDLAVGLGKVSQKRGSGTLELRRINVTELGGALVVPSFAELQRINPDQLARPYVQVAESGIFYTYNKDKKQWEAANGGRASTRSAAITVETIEELEFLDVRLGAVQVTDPLTGGLFIYDEKLKTVNDGGLVIHGWVRQYSGSVNVQWFGARGDGLSDDTESFQKAFAAANDIVIPQGSYKIYKPVSIKGGITIRGEGQVNIFMESLGACFQILSGTYHIKDLNIQTTYREKTTGILLSSGVDSVNIDGVIENCTFYFCGEGISIQSNPAERMWHKIQNCSFVGCTNAVAVNSDQTLIHNCTFTQGSVAIRCFKQAFIEDCIFQKFDLCFDLTAYTSKQVMGISNCRALECQKAVKASDFPNIAEDYRSRESVYVKDCDFFKTGVEVSGLSSPASLVFERCNLDNSNITLQSCRTSMVQFIRCRMAMVEARVSDTIPILHECTFQVLTDSSPHLTSGGSVSAECSSRVKPAAKGRQLVRFDSARASMNLGNSWGTTIPNIYNKDTATFNLPEASLNGSVTCSVTVYSDQPTDKLMIAIGRRGSETLITPNETLYGVGYKHFRFYLGRGSFQVYALSVDGQRSFLGDGEEFTDQFGNKQKASFSIGFGGW